MPKDSFLEIVVPVADYQDTGQRAAAHAVRPGSINGKRVLLLPSEKSSSPPFIRKLAQRMMAETAAKQVFMRNPDWAFFHPQRAAEIAPDIDALAHECDVMVTGAAY